MVRTLLAFGCATVLAACTVADGAPANPDFADEAALAAGQSVGPPKDCLTTRDIDRTKVVSDRVVDFMMKNHDVYRSTLAISCANLRAYGRFTYRTTVSRLCSSDVITVVDTSGHIGTTCGLGPFQRIDVPRSYH